MFLDDQTTVQISAARYGCTVVFYGITLPPRGQLQNDRKSYVCNVPPGGVAEVCEVDKEGVEVGV